MQKILFTLSLVLLLISCEKNNKFTIEGNIQNASGNILYLEHVGVSKVSVIDSAKLNAKGDFRFRRERSAFPEFYRLTLGKQSIDVAIDSTETISIKADSASFAKDYIIEGSENNIKIKELSALRASTANMLNKLDKSLANKEITPEEFINQARKAVDAYKEIAKKYIVENPGSAAAYYALFQTINGLVIFSPYDKSDNRLYGAVATQWDCLYSDSPLSMHVKNMGLMGMKALRTEQPLDYNVVKTTEALDIHLSTVSGERVRLSGIAQGKVTLLEFATYFEQGSPEHNMMLAKIYEKYKGRGFQIYQVSLDTDEHAWKNAAVNLPWIAVRDPQSIYSEIVRWYNVSTLPTGFILNREGEIVSRIADYKKLETEVIKYLK
ncbi:MAG: AhpC/TSA family protein [Dysgonamonadaceae bacterium]|jgi:alkyl hydroperoxide reductase subunit AhpC|nr:AhpC/TSA family protein [Dysgonamonadaceae bacterium]